MMARFLCRVWGHHWFSGELLSTDLYRDASPGIVRFCKRCHKKERVWNDGKVDILT